MLNAMTRYRAAADSAAVKIPSTATVNRPWRMGRGSFMGFGSSKKNSHGGGRAPRPPPYAALPWEATVVVKYDNPRMSSARYSASSGLALLLPHPHCPAMARRTAAAPILLALAASPLVGRAATEAPPASSPGSAASR